MDDAARQRRAIERMNKAPYHVGALKIPELAVGQPQNAMAWVYTYAGLLLNLGMVSHADLAKTTQGFMGHFGLPPPVWAPAVPPTEKGKPDG